MAQEELVDVQGPGPFQVRRHPLQGWTRLDGLTPQSQAHQHRRLGQRRPQVLVKLGPPIRQAQEG